MPTNEEISSWAQNNNIKPTDAAYWQEFIVRSKPIILLSLVWKPVLGVSIISSLIMIVCFFVLFRKNAGVISGPIYRITKTLQDIVDGKPVIPIKIRKKDYFSDLASLLNEVLSKNSNKNG